MKLIYAAAAAVAAAVAAELVVVYESLLATFLDCCQLCECLCRNHREEGEDFGVRESISYPAVQHSLSSTGSFVPPSFQFSVDTTKVIPSCYIFDTMPTLRV